LPDRRKRRSFARNFQLAALEDVVETDGVVARAKAARQANWEARGGAERS